MSNETDLSSWMGDALKACIEELGFTAPLHLVALGINGSVVLRTDRFDTRVLFKHCEDDMFRRPINVMVVESSGKAARFRIERDGMKRLN